MPEFPLLVVEGMISNNLTVLVNVLRGRIETVSSVLLGTKCVSRQLVVKLRQHRLIGGNFGIGLFGGHGDEVIRPDIVGRAS